MTLTSDPVQIANLLRIFSGSGLTTTLSNIEATVRGVTATDCPAFLSQVGAERDVLVAAAALKRLAGQVNVVIHALGILLCLPHILEEGEKVEYASLGAGNTGRDFDLETNYRVAEFKFINWRGGPESIRQNSIFKDFFLLAESNSTKRKYLYVLGTEHPMKFLKGGRALTSVLSKDEKVRKLFYARFDQRFAKVRDYFQLHQDKVSIVDVSPWLTELMIDMIADGAPSATDI